MYFSSKLTGEITFEENWSVLNECKMLRGLYDPLLIFDKRPPK